MIDRAAADSVAERSGLDAAGYVSAHQIANFMYFAATGVDVVLLNIAHVLRNSMPDADLVVAQASEEDGLDEEIRAALAIRPKPDQESIAFHEKEAQKWFLAIESAAHTEGWACFDLCTLAPLPRDHEGPFVVEARTLLDWAKRCTPPSIAEAVSRRFCREDSIAQPDGTSSQKQQASGNAGSEPADEAGEARALRNPARLGSEPQESCPTPRKRTESSAAKDRYERLLDRAQELDPLWKPGGDKPLRAGVKAELAEEENRSIEGFNNLWKKVMTYAKKRPARGN